MERRTYLGALGGASVTGLAGLAGCLDDAMGTVGLGDDSDTVLGSPDQSRGDPSHPIHGEAFPDFSVPDPITEETVSLEDFLDDRALLITFIFTACPDGACPALLTRLRRVQEDAIEEGYEDDIALLAYTFDPERDTADVLAEYGEEQSVDYEADNWHFLRPESYEEGEEWLMEDFGMQIERVEDEDEIADAHDHGGDEDGHDDHEGEDHDDHDHGEYTFTHINLVVLANSQGIVERAYPQAGPQSEHDDLGADIGVIVDDARTVAQNQSED
ncbi:SCO family protein [Natronolimnobius sp. AArcel1]|uniref:SCO family protein n=1 Tax=Natronolimnobius sp. AArcel1 TaxID=1679093 RepID=UPI0013EE17DA|nr:SCO family protein [Natronolimnobius sp. AArcel1]NGM71525.1 SCO family protein [Natronolimnobius sp. AArcel1]